MTSSKPQFQWDDPFFLEAQLSDEERMVRDAAKAFANDILMPRVIGDFRDEAFDPALLKEYLLICTERTKSSIIMKCLFDFGLFQLPFVIGLIKSLLMVKG